MDLLEKYQSRVEEKMPEHQREWMRWQGQLEEIKVNIRKIAVDFIGLVANDQHMWRLRYSIEEYLQQVRRQDIINDYKIDEVNRHGLRVMVKFPGAIDYRIISMRWS